MSGLRRLAQTLITPLRTAGTKYNRWAQRYPLGVGVVTTVVKTSAADLFAQRVFEKREYRDVDWRRNALFTFFGFSYLGCFQYWLYNNLFVRLCKPITAVVGHYGSAPVKVFIDQCIHHPLLYFPVFYLLKGSVEGRPVESSLAKYREDLWENCKALWTIWVPAQLVNFAVVPRHLRIPFVAGVSFAWTVVISVMRGALDSHDPELDPAEVPAKEQHVHSHWLADEHGHGMAQASNAAAAAATGAVVAVAATAAVSTNTAGAAGLAGSAMATGQ